jgi:hypothetical protein
MVIDNTGRIKRLIAGCGKDEFYMLQIIHRVKDGHTKYEPQDQKSTEQVIKTYYVSSPEYLERKMEEIRDLCRMFNARAMFNLNRKSWKQVGLKQLELTAQALGKEGKEEKWWKTIKSTVESACGQTGACDGNKTWVLDIDTKDQNELNNIVDFVNQCVPFVENKVVAVIPTVHGNHLITKPFDKKTFKSLYGTIHPGEKEDIIKENNPTILYVETQK